MPTHTPHMWWPPPLICTCYNAPCRSVSIVTHPHNLHLLQHTFWFAIVLPDTPSCSVFVYHLPPPPPLLSAWAGTGRARAVHRTHPNRHHTSIAMLIELTKSGLALWCGTMESWDLLWEHVRVIIVKGTALSYLPMINDKVCHDVIYYDTIGHVCCNMMCKITLYVGCCCCLCCCMSCSLLYCR